MKIQCECCGSQDMWKASVAYSQGRSSGSYAGSSYSSDGYESFEPSSSPETLIRVVLSSDLLTSIAIGLDKR
jgi:hypothetical protein